MMMRMTLAGRQGVDILVAVCVFVCVCLFVCMVTDFSSDDKASGVTSCTAVHRRSRQRIINCCELRCPKSPKSDELASALATPTRT